MQVKSIAECSTGSILQYFRPTLSYHFSFKDLYLSIFEWPRKTGFAVLFLSCDFKDTLKSLVYVSNRLDLSYDE